MTHLSRVITGVALAAAFLSPLPGTAQEQMRGRDLMSDEEWQAHRQTMRSMTSEQERARYRSETHTQMQERAAQQGGTLSGQPGSGRGYRGYDDAAGSGYGGGYGRGGGGGGYGGGRGRGGR
jgi:hypothetical protein